ncbi:MAG: ABC transporter ATP-binding protein, partial [Ktedonobacteraceae bacterium]
MMTPIVAEPSTNASTQQRSALLRVKHLNIDYETSGKPVHAVNDVSFTLHRGQILGLAGESGSGKSTLAYAITRLLHPPAVITGGEILYYPREDEQRESGAARGFPGPDTHKAEGDHKGPLPALPHPRPYNDYEDGLAGDVHSRGGGGVDDGWGPLRSPASPGIGDGMDRPASPPIDILQLSSKQLRAFRWQELAIVFQSAMNALNPVMRLETQIADVLEAHNPAMGRDERRQRALELLRLVGITPDRLRSYAHELSGGMRQRAIIAIALALNPEIIIMDEPTTALDVVVQRDILAELMALREHLNFAVIFITHDLSLLLEVADQVAIMYAGRIVEETSWQQLYRHPRHPYSHGLLNSFPSLRGPKRRMSGIPGSPPDLRNVPVGCA